MEPQPALVGHPPEGPRPLPPGAEPVHRQHAADPHDDAEHALQRRLLLRLDARAVRAEHDGGGGGGGGGAAGLLAGGAPALPAAAAAEEEPGPVAVRGAGRALGRPPPSAAPNVQYQRPGPPGQSGIFGNFSQYRESSVGSSTLVIFATCVQFCGHYRLQMQHLVPWRRVLG